MKVVCAGEGDCRAKTFCQIHNQTPKGKFPKSFLAQSIQPFWRSCGHLHTDRHTDGEGESKGQLRLQKVISLLLQDTGFNLRIRIKLHEQKTAIMSFSRCICVCAFLYTFKTHLSYSQIFIPRRFYGKQRLQFKLTLKICLKHCRKSFSKKNNLNHVISLSKHQSVSE